MSPPVSNSDEDYPYFVSDESLDDTEEFENWADGRLDK